MPEIMANTNHGKYPILIRTGALAQHEGIAQSLVRQCKVKLTLGDLCAILVLVHVPHLGTALNFSLAC